jgi:glycosyltransferase involved in cell wall biosynthesis
MIQFYQILRKVLKNEKIDGCFAHMMPIFSILGWPLLKINKVPIVLWHTHSHVSWLLRLATILVDKVVGAGYSGFGINTPKFEPIGQGIDTEIFLPSTMIKNQDELVILTVGRISPIKKLEVVLDSLRLLPERVRSRVILKYVGSPLGKNDINYFKQIKNKVIQNKLTEQVQFISERPFHEIQNIYKEADIFVNSSNTDSMDKTVLEAMSCGIPIITSNIAFIDVLGNELAKEWCIEKNNPAILAEKIEKLVNMDHSKKVVLSSKLRMIVVKGHSLFDLTSKVLQKF